MTDSKDLTTEVAKELAKQLPVKEAYGDLVAPGAKQAGGLVEDIVKTLRLALAPLQFAAALQDRYVRFLNEAIRRVPDQNLTSPPPQILGPVIEGIRYEESDTPISDMFSQLLSKAFDSTEVEKAHPSYPAIIRQLSSDEALILRALWERRTAPPYRRQYTMELAESGRRIVNQVIEIDELPVKILTFPANINFYIDHLFNLGLAALFKDDEKPIKNGSKQTGTRVFQTVRLTDMGTRFMVAVSPTCNLRRE